MEKPGRLLGAVSYGGQFLHGAKGGMGRGTDVSAGSSIREAALHPGEAQALPAVAVQRGANPGHLTLLLRPGWD